MKFGLRQLGRIVGHSCTINILLINVCQSIIFSLPHRHINILSELKNLVIRNTQNKPDPSKKSGTPIHNKPVNRPRRRIGSIQNVSFCQEVLKEQFRACTSV